MKVTARTAVPARIEPINIPSKVDYAEEVIHLHSEFKFLAARLKRTNHVYNDMQMVERAYFTLEASGITVNEEQFRNYLNARGEELVALYNKTSY